jgi:short-subunit dehydrogenase
MQLAGTRALVTGATGGIGTAIARELSARSCALVLSGRRAQELDRLAGELGPSARGIAADMADGAEIRQLLDSSGPLDVIVANAGVEVARALQDLGDAQVAEAVRVNLLAPLELARAAIPPMVERGAGHLVFISSVAGLVATPGNGPVYTATKWGLRGLGLALRQELHGTGVGVSTIFPGPIRDAGMFARTNVEMPRHAGTNSPQEVARAVISAIELDRAELTVAKGSVRISAQLGMIAPGLVGSLARRAGAGRVRAQMLAARRT